MELLNPSDRAEQAIDTLVQYHKPSEAPGRPTGPATGGNLPATLRQKIHTDRETLAASACAKCGGAVLFLYNLSVLLLLLRKPSFIRKPPLYVQDLN